MNLLGCSIVNFSIFFLDSTLVLNLITTYNVDVEFAGLTFFPAVLAFTLVCSIAGRLHWDKKIMIAINFFVMGFAYVFIGPSQILNVPSNPWVVVVGYVVLNGI